MNALNNGGVAIIAGVGDIFALYEMITIGVIVIFVEYSRQFTRPLNDLANQFNTLLSAIAGAERVFECTLIHYGASGTIRHGHSSRRLGHQPRAKAASVHRKGASRRSVHFNIRRSAISFHRNEYSRSTWAVNERTYVFRHCPSAKYHSKCRSNYSAQRRAHT